MRPGSAQHEDSLALIFDMDGVLVNSNPVHCHAWEIFNRRYGIETTEAMRQSMYGKRNDQVILDFYGDGLSGDEVSARGAAKEELFRELMRDRVEEYLVPGVRQFLERHRSYPMAVATNAELANLDFILDNGGLRAFFRVAIDGNQVSRPKPDPEIYLRAACQMGIAPANCIVFEDSYYGVEAARAAGARVVGLLTTHTELPGASLTIDNFGHGELESWLLAQQPVR